MCLTLLGMLCCIIRASFGRRCRQHKCWQVHFSAGWRALVRMYLFQIKIMLDLTNSQHWLFYHMALMPCVCRQETDGQSTKPLVRGNTQELFLLVSPKAILEDISLSDNISTMPSSHRARGWYSSSPLWKNRENLFSCSAPAESSQEAEKKYKSTARLHLCSNFKNRLGKHLWGVITTWVTRADPESAHGTDVTQEYSWHFWCLQWLLHAKASSLTVQPTQLHEETTYASPHVTGHLRLSSHTVCHIRAAPLNPLPAGLSWSSSASGPPHGLRPSPEYCFIQPKMCLLTLSCWCLQVLHAFWGTHSL